MLERMGALLFLLLALPVFGQLPPRLEVPPQTTLAVGQQAYLPVTWTGTKPWTALQATITLGDGLSVVSTTPGPLYTAAGCGSAINLVNPTTLKVAWACPHGSAGWPIMTLNITGVAAGLSVVAVWQCQVAEMGDAKMSRCLGDGGLVTVTAPAAATKVRHAQ